MNGNPQVNAEQSALWNSTSGRAWVVNQATLDRLFQPLEAFLMEPVQPGTAQRVLDVGCGTGAMTLAAARRLAPHGECTGLDISEPMLAIARERAAREGVPARFLRADAQTHAFAPASFDLILSRFGVMFFDDPVAAFANLRLAARPGGALRVIAWRSPAENPFMTTPERAAAPLLPDLPVGQPDAPGQFAFANRDRVAAILARSGWTDVNIGPIDVACTLAEKDLTNYIGWLGSVGRRLQSADAQTRTQVVQTVRAAFAPYVQGSEVHFTAACWLIDARVPAEQAHV